MKIFGAFYKKACTALKKHWQIPKGEKKVMKNYKQTFKNPEAIQNCLNKFSERYTTKSSIKKFVCFLVCLFVSGDYFLSSNSNTEMDPHKKNKNKTTKTSNQG